MAKRTVYTCDCCGKEADDTQETESMDLWLHLNCSFIVKAAAVNPPVIDNKMMGDFCSAECLKKFVERISKSKGRK